MMNKKKTLVIAMSGLLLGSCGTYTGEGAYVGGSFGSIIGSAIGGISGGWHGSNVGTLIGMAGGAVVGAAVGAAADNAQRQQYEDYKAQPPLHGDYVPNVSPTDDGIPPIEIRDAYLADASRDGVLTRGEEARMVFEVYNNSPKPVYNIQPTVSELTGNKHIRVSQNVLVESIMPGKGIRYTAVIKTDNKLKDGEAVIKITVFHNNMEIRSQAREFPIKTCKQ